MQNREQSVSYRQVADSPDFLLIRAKLRAMQATPFEAVKDFQGLLRDKKFASEGAAYFGLAIALGRQRQWAEAEEALHQAQKIRMPSAMLERQLAEVRLAQGKSDKALALYREAMVRFPFNQALLYGYAQALLKLRYFDEALRFVESQLQNTPQDLRLHKMRAESYAGLGRGAPQHQALAEVFSLQGQTAGAIDQLQHARNAGDANFYELSVIDARMRELRKRLLEEQKEKRN
jgi:predicted Zn-dependent protease